MLLLSGEKAPRGARRSGRAPSPPRGRAGTGCSGARCPQPGRGAWRWPWVLGHVLAIDPDAAHDAPGWALPQNQAGGPRAPPLPGAAALWQRGTALAQAGIQQGRRGRTERGEQTPRRAEIPHPAGGQLERGRPAAVLPRLRGPGADSETPQRSEPAPLSSRAASRSQAAGAFTGVAPGQVLTLACPGSRRAPRAAFHSPDSLHSW